MTSDPGRRVAHVAAALLVVALSGCGTATSPTPRPAPTATISEPVPTVSPDASPVPVVPHDRGAQLHASGSATKISGGYRYTIAKDDTAIGIGYRFGVCTEDVSRANNDNLDIEVGVRLNIRRVTGIPLDRSDCNL